MSDDADAAQARVLIAALRDQMAEMARRLRDVRAQADMDRARRDVALRHEANDLLRDINKAQYLIERLNSRFPEAGRVEASPTVSTS